MNKKLFLNSLSGTVLYIISIVVAFIMSPIFIKFLGNRDYGLWEMVMSVIGYMGLLDLGIGPALITFIATADGKNDYKDMQITMSSAFVFFIILGIVALIFFLILGFNPQLIAGSEAIDISNLGVVFFLLGVDTIMVFPLQVFITALMGVQRHYFINSIRAVLAIISAVLTYKLFILYPNKGLIILALLSPVFTCIQFILFAGVIWFDKKIPPIKLSAFSWVKMKELFQFGFKSMIMMIASRLQNQSVPIIIGKVIGLGSIVYFVIPNRLIDYAKGFSNSIGIPFTPFLSSSIAKGDKEYVQKSWLTTSLALQVVAMPISVFVFFFGETFISLWIGPEYAEKGHYVIYFLLIGLFTEAFSPNAFRLLLAKAVHGKCAIIWLILSIISIPIGVAGAYFFGVSGVVLGTTCVAVIGNIVSLIFACSVVNVTLINYFTNTLARLMIPLFLLLVSLWVMVSNYSANNYISLFLQCVFPGLIYCLSVWLFTLTADNRRRMIRQFKVK